MAGIAVLAQLSLVMGWLGRQATIFNLNRNDWAGMAIPCQAILTWLKLIDYLANLCTLIVMV